MATKLLAKAERVSAKATLNTLPALRRAAGTIAVAVAGLLDMRDSDGEWGVSLAQAWEEIEQVVPRSELTAALEQGERAGPRSGQRR